jgi:hypothetical protein
MEPTKLEDLRTRFSDREVFKDGDDPVLIEAGRQVQSPDGKRTKPYSGIPTFLGLPSASDLTNLDVAVIGVPMDLGVTNRPGARFGPRAVRTIERIGPYHPTFRMVPKGTVRAADVGDVPFRSRYSLEQSLEDIESYYSELAARGVRPLSVGGDHSITCPLTPMSARDARLRAFLSAGMHHHAHDHARLARPIAPRVIHALYDRAVARFQQHFVGIGHKVDFAPSDREHIQGIRAVHARVTFQLFPRWHMLLLYRLMQLLQDLDMFLPVADVRRDFQGAKNQTVAFGFPLRHTYRAVASQ